MTTSILSRLGETDELARCFFEESNDGLFVFDPRDLQLKEANPTAQRFTGMSRRELLSLHLRDLLMGGEDTAIGDLVQACQSTTVFHSREGFSLKRKNGAPLDVNISITRLHVKPEPLGVFVVRDISKRRRVELDLAEQNDRLEHLVQKRMHHLELVNGELRAEIDERQRAEEHLRQSQAKLNQIANSINEVVFLMSPDWKQAIYVSPAFEDVWDMNAAEMYADARCCLKKIHPEDRQQVLESMLRRESGELQDDAEYEFRIVRTDGEVRWLRSTVSPIRGESGEISRVAGTTADITPRKTFEEALRLSERRNRELLGDINAIVWQAELPSWEYTYISHQVESILGYSCEQWLETSDLLGQLVHDDDRRRAVEDSRRRALLGEDHEFDCRMTKVDGEFVWVHNTVHVVKDEAGLPIRARGVMLDVTARKLAEERLKVHEQELAHVSRLSTMGQMVAGIAHEINQPLFSIGNFSDACSNVLQRSPEMDQVLEWTLEIKKQSALAGQIIKRLANFVRNDAPCRDAVDVTELLQDAMELASFDARRGNVSVRLDLEEEENLVVIADAVQIQQVVINLLRNSYEALQANSHDDRRVTLRGETLQNRVQISVSDNGPGLMEGIEDKLFGAFFTTKQNGMGMGLAISRSIIDSHGGAIEVTTNDAGGATFTFWLNKPLEQPA